MLSTADARKLPFEGAIEVLRREPDVVIVPSLGTPPTFVIIRVLKSGRGPGPRSGDPGRVHPATGPTDPWLMTTSPFFSNFGRGSNL